eukprot:TRINITY_DN1114_c0_g1_i1.p1 TRINITY_DN1114_c0_g1~~TRINITY_DN1114_c0_g1_i1.p1  ORF type:complete len:253 (-),score=34.16 TRINITY_DN1114_c0_g1_i1:231-989(-)
MNNITFFKKVIVSSNEISYCNNNGITIISSYSKILQSPPEVILRKNTISKCKAAGIFAFDSVCTVSESYVTHNERFGILIANMKAITNAEYCQAAIVKSTISDNSGPGIKIVDSKDCNFMLESNTVENNTKTGITINANVEKNLPFAFLDNGSQLKATKKKCSEAGKIWIKGGKVRYNRGNGLEICHDQLFLNCTTIQANVGCALKLYGNYKNVKYTGKILTRRMIGGFVMSNNKKVDIYNTGEACMGCRIV